MTPTTAAVIAVSGAVKPMRPRVASASTRLQQGARSEAEDTGSLAADGPDDVIVLPASKF